MTMQLPSIQGQRTITIKMTPRQATCLALALRHVDVESGEADEFGDVLRELIWSHKMPATRDAA